MSGKVLLVFESQEQRENAAMLEGGGFPFKVGHLDKPKLILQALKKIKPDIVILYTEDSESRLYGLCNKIRTSGTSFNGLVAIYSPLVGICERDLAIECGADTIISDTGDESSFIIRIASLINTISVSREYLRRSHSLAKASAEAADIIVQLEEAGRRIREQNEQLKIRDAQIVSQQGEIERHLDKIKHELQLAASLQINLMPSGRKFSRDLPVDIHDRYIPAADLGGDYYDYIKLPDGGFFACVADVTGHGVAPALVTVQLRALARSHLQSGQSLPAVMSDLNTFMYETFKQEYLMTIAAIVYHPELSAVEFVGAGHCPIVHYIKNDDMCRERFSTGLPLGVIEDSAYTPTYFDIAEGDKLFMYTDGITEANDDNEVEYSPERLIECFHQLIKSGCDNILDQLLDNVSEYTGNKPLFDDVTLVLMERP